MLGAIIRFSLRFRGVIIALACVLVGYGLYALSQARYDVYPEFAPPQVVIQAEAPGLAPEQVEVLITQPIENAVNGVQGIEAIRSASIQGLSVVTVTFPAASDIYRDRQLVAEEMTALSGNVPARPVLSLLTSSTSVVLIIGFTSEKRSLMDLRTLADWTVKPQLLAVPGVAKVAVFGGEVKQFQVQVLPERLVKHNLSIDEVVAAARRATGVQGAGFIESSNQRIVIQTQGQSLTAGELAKIPVVHHEGASVTLGDLGEVVEAAEPPIGAASILGREGVQLAVSAQYGANTLEVTRRLERALDDLRPALAKEAVELRADVFRPANFIHRAVGNIRSSLLLGAALVVIVLFLFLFDLRTAAISCTAIPLSLLAAVILLEKFGASLNTMTLGGLAIAIGEVVDDAVIDVENIQRRLRENRRGEQPRPALQVVFEASIEVRNAVVYATLAVILVFLPILTLSGLAGRLFGPLGIAYILAVLSSLAVALTVTPALCLILLGRGESKREEPPVVRWLKARYRRLIESVEKRPRTVLACAVILVLAGLATIPFFGGGFLPDLNEGHFILHMNAVPGTSMQESLRLGREVTLALMKNPDIRCVAQRVGRAERGDDFPGPHNSEFEVDLKPLSGDETERVQAEIRSALAEFPGVNFSLNAFLTERVEETLSGYTAPVAVNLFGRDLDVLDAKAKEVARALGAVPGAVEVQVQSPPGAPQLVVQLRKGDLERWGLQPADVLDDIGAAFQGAVAGQVYDGNRVFDVAVILASEARRSIEQVGTLPLRNASGTFVRLKAVADIYEGCGRYAIFHEGARRVQTVTCGVAGRDVESFVADAKARIHRSVELPLGVYMEFAGAAQAGSSARRELIVHSLIAGAAIVLLLSIVTGHWRNLLLVLANLPFALLGGVLAVFASGGWLTLGAMVGFVTLFGITLRNSILMISHYEHLVSEEGMTWGLDTAVRGASERLAPILMTAMVTGLGLLPLALGSGEPGREIEGPMAMVILGGLVTSTVLNLVVLPTLALRYGRFAPAQGSGGKQDA